MDLEHGKRRDKIMDRDSEWIHNAEKKGVYFVWGPVAHTYLYTNVYQGRAWFDQIIENSTSRYQCSFKYESRLSMKKFDTIKIT